VNANFLASLFGLDGKVALVTGASGGIGRALAEGLAKAGATVALNGRQVDRLEAVRTSIEADGGAAAVFPADLSDLEQVRGLAEAVAERLGRIDVLVNCAGMNRRQPIAEVTAATYDEIMNANLRSAYFLSQAVVPTMAAGGGGKIVHVGSINVAVGLHSVSVYGLSKSALAQTTKVMAIEWAEQNIQVNCLCPGFIETELTQPLWQSSRRDWIMARQPLKRPGQPADLVGMCIYLASPAASFTTGQAFYVDGGFLAGSSW
jgi:NAD(P)-dependent dehydrogenase (short-subunit alcohol dehydrogenase family)